MRSVSGCALLCFFAAASTACRDDLLHALFDAGTTGDQDDTPDFLDAGTTDAGTTDAGTSDAGTSDAGTVDAGPSDPPPFCGWRQVTLADHPAARLGATMSSAPTPGVLLFGGGTAATPEDDTWTFNADTWSEPTPATTPPPRITAAMAASPTDVVVFGGANRANIVPDFISDTWRFNGTDWVEHTTTPHPTKRSYAGLAFDSRNDVFVLFGGCDGHECPHQLGDTWTFDVATGWHQMTPAHSPPARSAHCLVDDRARNQVLLFGGQDGASQLSDSWGWNGTDWTQLAPTSSPSQRGNPTCTYDERQNVVVMFGGFGGDPPGNQMLDDVWVYSGTWSPVSLTPRPPTRTTHSMAYDTATGLHVVFGGFRENGTLPQFLSDTWELGLCL